MAWWKRKTFPFVLITSLASLVVVTFHVAPAGYSVILSLYEAHLLFPSRVFAGFSNYARLLDDPAFWLSMWATTRYVIGTVSGAILAGVVLAAALRRPGLWSAVMRVGFLVPALLPTVVSATLWSWLYDPCYGLVNRAIALLGASGPAWLKDPTWALAALVLMNVWREAGLAMVIYLAALAGIPGDVLAAAQVDGASTWQEWRYVIVPLLRPATYVVVLTSGFRALHAFAPMFVMTGGGPAGATATWGFRLYVTAFEQREIGYASAVAVAVGMVLLIILALAHRHIKPERMIRI